MSAAVLPFPLPAPAYSSAIAPALAGIASPHTRRAYATGMRLLVGWLGPRPLDVAAVREWVDHLAAGGASASTINLRLAAVRRLATALEEAGRLDTATASRIARHGGRKRHGVRLGKWLTQAQAQAIVDRLDLATPDGLLDAAVFALLYGAGLRRSEAAQLTPADLVSRDGQWVLRIVGKGGKERSFAVGDWVADLLHRWMATRPGPEVLGIGVDAIRDHVAKLGALIGETLRPHDLRRSCGRHIVDNGGAIEQVQMMYGHADVKTTRVYLNLEIDFKDPPAKRLRVRIGGGV